MLLVSLYLPWRAAAASCGVDDYFGGQSGAASGLLHLFSGPETKDGLSSELGRALALFALLVAALGTAAWARPSLARRLPLGTCALLAGYFGVAVGVQMRSDPFPLQGCASHYAYGAYVGLVATIVVLVAGALARRAELMRYLSASPLVMLVLVGGLLSTFLLPWWEQPADPTPTNITWIGLTSPAAVIAAALAVCLPGIWDRADTTPAERLGLAVAVALFTGGAAGSSTFLAARVYGVWPALAIAGALVVLALVEGPRRLRLADSSWRQLSVCAAALLFLGSLFLPWQRWCYGAGSEFGPLAGHCFAANAWITPAAAVAALLAMVLVVGALEPRRLRLPVVDVAAAMGLLVATVGFEFRDADAFELAYGSTIGFICVGVLIAVVLMLSRLPTVDWHRLFVRLLPIAVCLSYLVIVVLPWWDVLSRDAEASLTFAELSWLTMAGAVLGIYLLGLWVRQIAAPSGSPALVLVPLALLALTAVDLIDFLDEGVDWAGGAIVGLCLLLAVLGRMEQRGGLDSVRLPEILRVDRL